MLYGFNTNEDNDMKDFHQRVADQNIQNIENRQDEIRHAKNGFLGILAGIIVGGIVGWLFLGPADNLNQKKVIPVIRRPLIQAKVQPNEPGGMEIDNQNREIYHIIDNLPKEEKEVNLIPVPEAPKLIVENTIPTPENMDTLVESIEEEGSLKHYDDKISEDNVENIKLADTELTSVKTNSSEKIIIPQKIKEIDVKVQKTVTPGTSREQTKTAKPEAPQKIKIQTADKAAKGTWYAQIIASSSRKSVETLLAQLVTKHAFLNNYPHEIEEITAANGSKLYRLKIGAFKARAQAEELSKKLKQNQISSIIKQN